MELSGEYQLEQRFGLRQQNRRAGRADAKAHLTLARVVEPDLAVRRLESACQCRLAATPGFQSGEREFDVLARAQMIGCKIRTGAEVLPGRAAADRHAVPGAAHGVVHAEVGEHRVTAEFLQVEWLLAPELAAQRGLPVRDLEVGRAARARQAWFGRLRGFAGLDLRSRFGCRARRHGRDVALEGLSFCHARTAQLGAALRYRIFPARTHSYADQ
jgi:hypothetical protein